VAQTTFPADRRKKKSVDNLFRLLAGCRFGLFELIQEIKGTISSTYLDKSIVLFDYLGCTGVKCCSPRKGGCVGKRAVQRLSPELEHIARK